MITIHPSQYHEVHLKNDSTPLQPKAHWKKRHYKKNRQKQENNIVNILVEETRREIDEQILAQILEIARTKH